MLAGVMVLGLAATDARAACAPQTARQRDERAPLILTGVIESGPVTPARMRVEAWEKGRGPATVDLDTGIYDYGAFGEGISPQPGERWRIFGQLNDGQIVTGSCFGSHAVAAPPVAPALAIGSASVPAVQSTFAGRPLSAALSQLRVAPGKPRALRVPAGVEDLRLLGARGGVRLTAKRGRWTLHVPAGRRPGGRIVADTGDAFFAVALQASQRRSRS